MMLEDSQKETIRGFLKYLHMREICIAQPFGEPDEEGQIPYNFYHIEPAVVEGLIDHYAQALEPRVVTFKSIDELIAYMEGVPPREEIPVAPWQQALKPGDCFIYFDGDLKIWGRAIAPYPEDAPLYAEKPYLVLAECFSEACREGEVGNIHKAQIRQKISLAEFDLAVKVFKDGPCYDTK